MLALRKTLSRVLALALFPSRAFHVCNMSNAWLEWEEKEAKLDELYNCEDVYASTKNHSCKFNSQP